MKYYIVKNTEGVQGHWGAFDTQAEAETQTFTFDTVIVSSEISPNRALFEKVGENWVVTERPKTSVDYAQEYIPRAIRGQKIIDDTRTDRLKQVEAGTISISAATSIDAETALIQFKLQSGDLLTAKVLTEQLADSTHKTEILALINTAISELY